MRCSQFGLLEGHELAPAGYRERLLCQADGLRDAGWVGEESVDPAHEVAFERSDGFALGLAARALASEVDGGFGVVDELADREHVEGVVELTVSAAIEAMAVGSP